MQLKKPPVYDKDPISTFCLHREERYPIDRTYQREEGTWETKDEQYLIDTILRGYPMPPIFLHEKGELEYIVDGQQRLNAIWLFKDGKGKPKDILELGETYSADIIKENNGKKRYGELTKDFQDRFDSYPVPIIYLKDYNDEEIRDVFRRLQHGKPLNVGENLNAYAGTIVITMRSLAKHKFFKDIISVKAKRYKHYHIAAILMYLEQEGIKDISPKYLEDFFEKNKNINTSSKVYSKVISVLNFLEKTFGSRTGELYKVSWIVTLYLVTSHLIEDYAMKPHMQNLKNFFFGFYQKVLSEGDKELVSFKFAVSRGTTSEANIKLRYNVMLKRFLTQYNPARLGEDRLFSHNQKLEIYHRDGEKCQICGKHLVFGDPETQYHHKDRFIEGGLTEVDKGLLVCRDCHLNKIHGKASK